MGVCYSIGENMSYFLFVISVLTLSKLTLSLDNGVARTPPMGWLAWERFACNTDCTNDPDNCISEKLFMDMADHLAADGFKELGYEFINIDLSCWGAKMYRVSRESVELLLKANPNVNQLNKNGNSALMAAATSGNKEVVKMLLAYNADPHVRGTNKHTDCWASKERDAQGKLQADPTRFPNGIKKLADYVHSKGLKLGIYGDFGTHTCGGYPGSIDNLKLDTQTFADWGVDMLKLDGCNADRNIMPEGYLNVSRMLNATGRHIVFSCSWPAYWNGAGMKINYTFLGESCNLWRNYGDISDSWDSVKSIVSFYTSHQDEFQPAAGPGHWNDPDMLIIGDFGLSVDEQRAQFAIWSVLAAPLLMSNDLRQLSPESKQILQNSDIIAVNQDKLGKQARMVASGNGYMVLSKLLADGSFAVVFFNTGSFSGPRNITIDFKTVGLTSMKADIRDLYAGKDLSTFSNQYTARVDPSSVVMVTMKPVQ